MKTPFIATHYKGRPAVVDTVSRVLYYGFRTMREARERAAELNKSED